MPAISQLLEQILLKRYLQVSRQMRAFSLSCEVSCWQVCDETIPFSGGLIALSSFGFGGANMHLVMEGKGGSRIKMLRDSQDGSSEDEQIQGVIPLAARTADGLVYLAKIIKKVRHNQWLH